MNKMIYEKQIEKWDFIEIKIKGKSDGNPFKDYKIQGLFWSKNEKISVDGFYDGNGIYIVRFMPNFVGKYNFKLEGNFSEGEYIGDFHVVEAGQNNHGSVKVVNTYHFAYEDGTPYYSIGTTCYVWNLQNIKLQEQTLETLKKSAFNKIRFCIFPKHYDYNFNEPISYPFLGKPCDNSKLNRDNFIQYTGNVKGNEWDFEHFNPQHFQLIEKRIGELREMNIEADLILFHPYDRWGFSEMTSETDAFYLKYVIARFGAYRNVWWSLANEYDLMTNKSLKDWEKIAEIICDKDPYNRLKSIHNCRPFYDHTKAWITHCSIQRQDVYKSGELVDEWRRRYKKPIVIDEIAYEGNIEHGWGNISGKEIVRRFWEATCRGGYAGHGETYLGYKDILWWSHGGELYGESPKRFEFLKKILEEKPEGGLMPYSMARWDEVAATIEGEYLEIRYLLIYFGFNRPSFREYFFDDTTLFEVDLIDTWEMTVKRMGKYKGKFIIDMPGKEYMALRIKKV